MDRSSFLFVSVTGFLIWAAVAMAGPGIGDQKPTAPTVGQPDWEIPVAAGVWYPGDGPLPEKPMRYYRARCWPGCHVGSSYGKYPDKSLDEKPIWMTSTIDGRIQAPDTTVPSHTPTNKD